jgi:hypothetical protein
MIKSLLGMLFVSLLLTGCGSEPAKKNTGLDTIKKSDAEILRDKAKTSGAVSKMIGYDGDKINKDLNTIINKIAAARFAICASVPKNNMRTCVARVRIATSSFSFIF